MLNDEIWPAMARAFEGCPRRLGRSDAGCSGRSARRGGGDVRGRQSAALVVVTGKPTGNVWTDRIFDLRMDDNPEPLGS
jgi:uncharacterized Ntn-hydrolase superfamily protein